MGMPSVVGAAASMLFSNNKRQEPAEKSDWPIIEKIDPKVTALYHNTQELTTEEYKNLMEYLVNNDLVLFYDSSKNGFSVRKENFGWKEQGKIYTYIDSRV